MTEEKAIMQQPDEQRQLAPLTARDVRVQVNLIQEVMKEVMKSGTHYGVIPGCQKPSLWKAGAEKLCATFRISARLKQVDDLSAAGEIRYRVTVQGISPSGAVVAEGIGEASSLQTKYAWREAVCPEEFEATPEDKRREIWKKGYQGKPTFKVRQIRTNPADQANTILKMAHKSGFIAMVLLATGASDIFTQDIEDLPEFENTLKEAEEIQTHPPQRKEPTPPAAVTPAAPPQPAQREPGEDEPPSEEPPPDENVPQQTMSYPNPEDAISEAKCKRFWAIAASTGKTKDKEKVKDYLLSKGIAEGDPKYIPWRGKLYEEICRWAETK